LSYLGPRVSTGTTSIHSSIFFVSAELPEINEMMMTMTVWRAGL